MNVKSSSCHMKILAAVAGMGLAMGLLAAVPAARADSALAWGDNQFGQLGNGSNTDSNGPVAVTGLSSGVTAVAAGGLHSLAIQNGAAYAWGYNNDGELGNGSNSNGNVPVAVKGVGGTGSLSGVTALAGGGFHSLAIQNGAVYAWGYNGNGELGNGSNTDSNVPVAVSNLSSGVTAIAAGRDHSLAIQNGAVYARGYNGDGELGNGSNTNSNVPVAVSNLSSGVTAIAAGWDFSLAIQNGNVYAWGDNSNGELGDGSTTERNTPIEIDPAILSNIVAVAAGDSSSYALSSDGSLWVWGDNSYGELGLGRSTSHYATPQHLLAPSGYRFTSIDADAHGYHALATLAALPSAVPTPAAWSGGLALLALVGVPSLLRRRRGLQ